MCGQAGETLSFCFSKQLQLSLQVRFLPLGQLREDDAVFHLGGRELPHADDLAVEVHVSGLVVQFGLDMYVQADVVFVIGYDTGAVEADILNLTRLRHGSQSRVVPVINRGAAVYDVAREHALVGLVGDPDVRNLDVQHGGVCDGPCQDKIAAGVFGAAKDADLLASSNSRHAHFAREAH